MPTREDFETALRYAREAFARIDPAKQARRCGARFENLAQEKSHIVLEFLNRTYEIIHPDGDVRFADESESSPPLWEQIINLHYLDHAEGKPITGKLIAFDGVSSGPFYRDAFERRTAGILLKVFADKPEALEVCADQIGAKPNELGDVGFTVNAFPCVPITVVFWRADEEFAARANFLFDSSVSSFLPTEDITLTSQMLAIKLVKIYYSK